jgi:hypothetical protein
LSYWAKRNISSVVRDALVEKSEILLFAQNDIVRSLIS